ncbi:cold shock domain-containing protein [Photobacterium leiognathi]|uniref:cold shock domain-containing protein n=1 Tax=Photobacterium leiognathi TaxID=553611 RepID=UPI0027386557|nr:cold shock domain-containing protein [Photobacterium leiognathi]
MSFEFGTVEWFGGFSEKMNRELEYGFIKPIISASDFTSKSDYLISLKEANIFVHKKALVNAESLNSDDYVMFKIEERNGKKSAQCVHNINKESLDENILEAVISGISSNEDVISNNVLKMIIAEILRSSHAKRFISKLYEVKSLSTVIGYLKLVLIDSPHVSEFLDSNLSVEQRILDYPETITNSFINSDAAFNGFCKILTNKQEDEKNRIIKDDWY